MNFDDLLKAWAKAKDQFVIDEAPSLCRKDIPDGAINIGQTYSSIAFYGGGSHFDLFRCAYVNPFASNFSRVLEEDKRKKLNEIANKFFGDAGILIIPIPSLKNRNKNNINFLCKILGECSEIEPRSEVSRIPFPLVQIGAEVKQTRWNVIYPEDTILWGCFWPFDIRPIDTEAIELYKYSEIHNTQNDKLKFDNFTYYENHRFRTFSSMNNPYISLDEVTYLDKTLSVSFAVMINTGAIIGVPEVAKDQLIADLVSFKKGSAPELKGFDLIFKWQKQAMAIGTALPENKTPITIPSGPLPELCGALEVNIQDKVTADNVATTPTTSGDVDGTPTSGKENNQAQVIDVDFDSFNGKIIKYRVNNVVKEAKQKTSALRFLAFNAGCLQKYCFVFNDLKRKPEKKKVLLLRNQTDFWELTTLFKKNGVPITNTTDAIPDFFWQFLPSNDDQDQKFRKKELAQQLFVMNEKHYPESSYHVNSNGQIELTDKKKKPEEWLLKL